MCIWAIMPLLSFWLLVFGKVLLTNPCTYYVHSLFSLASDKVCVKQLKLFKLDHIFINYITLRQMAEQLFYKVRFDVPQFIRVLLYSMYNVFTVKVKIQYPKSLFIVYFSYVLLLIKNVTGIPLKYFNSLSVTESQK